MQTAFGHLTYCTNIHAGESWDDHFDALKKNIPAIKKQVGHDKPFGIGLRLSHLASIALGKPEKLEAFKSWLTENHCYVFTLNGFPYGGFHHTKVKDSVHLPDWTTQDRVLYTIQLFNILSALLPAGLEGGVSTSPLSYKHWHDTSKESHGSALENSTWNILQVAEVLIKLKDAAGQSMHLDIEPEPDGLIESGAEFLSWYEQYLLPMGIAYLKKQLGFTHEQSILSLKEHVQLCYDVCHFAVGYENHAEVIRQLREKKIRVGKIQISAALKAGMAPVPAERTEVIDAFKQFNESTYLHQVVALQAGSEMIRYPDLPQALKDARNPTVSEWRSHFHVPLFVKDYGVLHSTQDDINAVLGMHRSKSLTNHLEVETYTWEVLPDDLKLPLTESISRELQWVQQMLE